MTTEPETHNEDVTAGMLAEAENLLGITGPRYAIKVDGHMYRLMTHPAEQPEAAAAIFAEMVFMIRHWFTENPEAAAEMSEYGVPMDPEISALPFVAQMAVFLGLSLEIYGRKHANAEAEDAS